LPSRHLGLRGGVLQARRPSELFQESLMVSLLSLSRMQWNQEAVELRNAGFPAARRADWKVGVTTMRSMESFNLQNWTRIGAMSRKGAAASASPPWSAAVLCRFANATRWRKRQRTAALQDLAEHWGGSGKASMPFGAHWEPKQLVGDEVTSV
jgi:hypothetical protein